MTVDGVQLPNAGYVGRNYVVNSSSNGSRVVEIDGRRWILPVEVVSTTTGWKIKEGLRICDPEPPKECFHIYDTKELFTSTYKKCRRCGHEI